MGEAHPRPVSYSDYPEAVHPTQSPFPEVHADGADFYDPPPASPPSPYAGFDRSPAPEYQPFSTSRATSPAHDSALGAASPHLSEGSIKRRPISPSAHYAALPFSEIHSPAPETVRENHDKIVVPPYTKEEPAATQAHVAEVADEKKDGDAPAAAERKPWYRRRRWILALILAFIIFVIVLAVPLGVVLGKHKSSKSKPTQSDGNVSIDGDPDTTVGGALNPAYYSHTGAFNGSGVAIAAANPGVDRSIYAFYQDAQGDLQYTLMKADDTWSRVGPVNDGSHKALNGTPLSAVNHLIGNKLVWHLFYIDEDYIIRERILTNDTAGQYTPTWDDGPLNDQNLQTNKADTVGMQACYWGNYYGLWSYNETAPSAGIHLWYASSSTAFQQYSWTNGTNEWIFDRSWSDLSGHAGVGCQTWDSGMTEYVWFVDTKHNIAMFWKDNNQTLKATAGHPINTWTPITLPINAVHESSSLGYTNYMIYQATDASIHGANVTWQAENTTIATKNGADDTWIIEDLRGNEISAVRGTHIAITALKTNSGGARLATFFQRGGDDLSMYTRDDTAGLWQEALAPVAPAS